MNRYKCSDGTRVNKSTVDSRIRQAKKIKLDKQIEEHGYNFCEKKGCKISHSTWLDCSHIESIKSCQENGRTEKAWDINNMDILCRYHHRSYDGLDLKFTKTSKVNSK